MMKSSRQKLCLTRSPIAISTLLLLTYLRYQPIECKSLTYDQENIRQLKANFSDDNKWIPIRDFKSQESLSSTDQANFASIEPMRASESQSSHRSSASAQGQIETRGRVNCSERQASEQDKVDASESLANFVKSKLPIISRHAIHEQVRRDEPEQYGDGDDADTEAEIIKVAEMLHGPDSVSLESVLVPQNDRRQPQQRQQAFQPPGEVIDEAESELDNDQEQESEQEPEQQVPESEAKARAEQEAAEASEAEAADRSALDEQQQAQREIIMAQAQSEAKAIKEQQESLLRQTKLQQQMLLRQNRELEKNNSDVRHAHRANADMRQYRQSQRHETPSYPQYSPRAHRQNDILFSDQPDRTNHNSGNAVNQDENQDEMSDYSVHQSKHIQPDSELSKKDPDDLLQSAQHHYGSHYGTLHGHSKDYYMYAESHKKGQFDSGFKRGGKKFHISGHSSQHKSHAEGHVKWKGKKGKGSQYWDYKHKGKKGHHYY